MPVVPRRAAERAHDIDDDTRLLTASLPQGAYPSLLTDPETPPAVKGIADRPEIRIPAARPRALLGAPSPAWLPFWRSVWGRGSRSVAPAGRTVITPQRTTRPLIGRTCPRDCSSTPGAAATESAWLDRPGSEAPRGYPSPSASRTTPIRSTRPDLYAIPMRRRTLRAVLPKVGARVAPGDFAAKEGIARFPVERWQLCQPVRDARSTKMNLDAGGGERRIQDIHIGPEDPSSHHH